MIATLRRKKPDDTTVFGNPHITPRPHQVEALEAFHASLSQGKNRMVFIMATATGKTNVAIWAIEDFIKEHGGGRVLFISHLDQIWHQVDERFAEVAPALSRGFFIGSQKSSLNATVINASVMTLHYAIKRETIPFAPDYFRFIVIDEFHHVAMETYKTVLEYFKPEVLVGMSCIKERHDEKDILSFFDNNIAYEIDTVTAINEKAIADFTYIALKDDINYDIHVNGYDYKETDQNRRLIIPKKDRRVIQKYKEIAGGKKTIAFCATIAHAERMVEYLKKLGISAVAIYHHDDISLMEQRTADFRDGKYQVACTIDKWLEGADFPDVEVGLFLRPTKSWRVFIQARGRVLRRIPGVKERGIVIDAVGNHKNVRIYKNLLLEHAIAMLVDLGRVDEIAGVRRLFDEDFLAFKVLYKQLKVEWMAFKYPGGGKGGGSTGKGILKVDPGNFILDVEEVQDIFEQLGEVDTWERGCKETLIYRETFVDANAPISYVSPGGFKLGEWQHSQRRYYKNRQLSHDRVARLEAVGLIWDQLASAWEKGFKETLEYKNQHGDPNAPASYVSPGGFKLGVWQGLQRRSYKNRQLSHDRVARMEAVGFIWDQLASAWEEGFKETLEYKNQHGDPNAPASYVSPGGFKLGSWQSTLVKLYKSQKMLPERVARLEAVGFIWDQLASAWEEWFKETLEYKNQHSDPNAPASYVSPGGFKLGSWQSNQMALYKSQKMLPERVARLEAVGFIWDRMASAWEEGFKETLEYKNQHGDPNAPYIYVSPNGFKLGVWQGYQMKRNREKHLTKEQYRRLTEIGFKFQLK